MSEFWKRFSRNRSAVLGLVILILVDAEIISENAQWFQSLEKIIEVSIPKDIIELN